MEWVSTFHSVVSTTVFRLVPVKTGIRLIDSDCVQYGRVIKWNVPFYQERNPERLSERFLDQTDTCYHVPVAFSSRNDRRFFVNGEVFLSNTSLRLPAFRINSQNGQVGSIPLKRLVVGRFSLSWPFGQTRFAIRESDYHVLDKDQ